MASRTLMGRLWCAAAGLLCVSCGATDASVSAPATLVGVAESPNSDVANTPPTSVPPVTTSTIDVPARIIPADGDIAEIVFALGLGNQVVATDISATFPAAADALPEIGYQRALAAESILAFEPTIVLATDIAGPAETLDDLERLGVEIVVVPSESSADGPGGKIRAVADALGVSEEGARLASTVDAAIAAALKRASGATDAPIVGALYVRGANVQLVLGKGGGVDWLLELPGIAETPAGRDSRVLVYDDQYLLGNGPRTGDFLNQLITDLHGDI